MSEDDEDTWRKLRPKSSRPEGESVSSSRDLRRMTDSQRQRLGETEASSGNGQAFKPDDWTSPIDLYERPPNEAENEIIKRLRRDSDVSKVMEYVGKLAHRLQRQRDDERSGNEMRANQLLELLNRPPNEMTAKLAREVSAMRDEIAEVKRFRKASLWALGVIATAAFGGLGTTIKVLYDRGYDEGRDAVRIQQLERQYDRFERQYDRDRRQDFPSSPNK